MRDLRIACGGGGAPKDDVPGTLDPDDTAGGLARDPTVFPVVPEDDIPDCPTDLQIDLP